MTACSIRTCVGPSARLAGGGVVVALVTGRRLDDLRRAAGDVSCFDVVVAENGGVLHFPASGRHVALGHPPRHAFIDELRRLGVPFTLGETLVEMAATFAPTVLQAVRTLEQPLVLAFNRGRLMLLPPAVSKSTGLRQALGELRLSIHNTVAIGDGENDHDLLDACEVGVAVAWGSPALRVVADEVIEGTRPAAVATYIARPAAPTATLGGSDGAPHLVPGASARRRSDDSGGARPDDPDCRRTRHG